MSVALFGKLANKEEIYFPFSTQKAYQEYILPIAKEKNLFWLERTGFPVDLNNIQEILAEFEVILGELQIKHIDRYSFFKTRIEPISTCLNGLLDMEEFELSFG